MVTGFEISETSASHWLLAYYREKRMLEKRIQYWRNRGYEDNSPKLINRLARLADLTDRLIPTAKIRELPSKRSTQTPYHCIW